LLNHAQKIINGGKVMGEKVERVIVEERVKQQGNQTQQEKASPNIMQLLEKHSTGAND
jgi:hypothetical protein